MHVHYMYPCDLMFSNIHTYTVNIRYRLADKNPGIKFNDFVLEQHFTVIIHHLRVGIMRLYCDINKFTG